MTEFEVRLNQLVRFLILAKSQGVSPSDNADIDEHVHTIAETIKRIAGAEAALSLQTDKVIRLEQQLRMTVDLTPKQKNALAKVLTRIGSWTEARWDQHLRYDVGDEDTDAIIRWLGEHGIGPHLG